MGSIFGSLVSFVCAIFSMTGGSGTFDGQWHRKCDGSASDLDR